MVLLLVTGALSDVCSSIMQSIAEGLIWYRSLQCWESYVKSNSFHLQVTFFVTFNIIIAWLNKMLSYRRDRNRAAGCVNFGQKWKTGIGRQYFTDIIGLSSTTVT